MGIYADIVESILDMATILIYMGKGAFKKSNSDRYRILGSQSISKKLQKNTTEKLYHVEKRNSEEIRNELYHLEYVKYVNHMMEKQIIFLQGKEALKSVLVEEILQDMINLSIDGCKYIDKIKQRIDTSALKVTYQIMEIYLRKEQDTSKLQKNGLAI